MITGYDKSRHPIYMSENEARWHSHFEDVHWDESEMNRRDLQLKSEAEAWLHGLENLSYETDGREIMVRLALLSVQASENEPFIPKPARDIRREKTREYRKSRLRVRRINTDIVPSIALLSCLLGLSS